MLNYHYSSKKGCMEKEIGKIIHFHRKKAGLSQVQLADLAGLGKTVVYDAEKGKLSIRYETLLKLLSVLNISIEFQSPFMKAFKKKAKVFVNGTFAGELLEIERGKLYRFNYDEKYVGQSVSLEMPLSMRSFDYDRFPPFFEGVLPEGLMLEGLLKQAKIDRNDLMSQLIVVGGDLVGNVTVEAG